MRQLAGTSAIVSSIQTDSWYSGSRIRRLLLELVENQLTTRESELHGGVASVAVQKSAAERRIDGDWRYPALSVTPGNKFCHHSPVNIF